MLIIKRHTDYTSSYKELSYSKKSIDFLIFSPSFFVMHHPLILPREDYFRTKYHFELYGGIFCYILITINKPV